MVALVCIASIVASQASPARQPVKRSHIMLIVLENHEYDEVIGNPQAPFLNRLATRGALATRHYAITHPSLPNYLALLGGSTFGVTDNCLDCTAPGLNLAAQMSRAGVSWRAYMEGMPHRCFTGDSSGEYAKRHNPFVYFPSLTSVPRRCARIVPQSRLDADLRRRSLPSFAWLSPGTCNDAHDCGIGAADRYLAKLVPRITRQLGPRGVLMITFDEGSSDAGCCGTPGGGRVMTLLVGPTVRRGVHLRRSYDHYSLTATIEDAFGLPRLRHARGARPLSAAFRHLQASAAPTRSAVL